MLQSSSALNDTSAQFPPRVVRWALIYSPGMAESVEGVIVDISERDRLANWICKMDACNRHTHEQDSLRSGLVDAGGACDKCRESAAFWLSESPYVEMNRAPELKVEGLDS